MQNKYYIVGLVDWSSVIRTGDIAKNTNYNQDLSCSTGVYDISQLGASNIVITYNGQCHIIGINSSGTATNIFNNTSWSSGSITKSVAGYTTVVYQVVNAEAYATIKFT